MLQVLRAGSLRPPDDVYCKVRTVVLADTASRALGRIIDLRWKDPFLRHAASQLEYLDWAEFNADSASFA